MLAVTDRPHRRRDDCWVGAGGRLSGRRYDGAHQERHQAARPGGWAGRRGRARWSVLVSMSGVLK